MVTADAKGRQPIRRDNWKYVDDKDPSGKTIGNPLLYNLSNDPAENTNLYEEEQKIVQQLSEELKEHLSTG